MENKLLNAEFAIRFRILTWSNSHPLKNPTADTPNVSINSAKRMRYINWMLCSFIPMSTTAWIKKGNSNCNKLPTTKLKINGNTRFLQGRMDGIGIFMFIIINQLLNASRIKTVSEALKKYLFFSASVLFT